MLGVVSWLPTQRDTCSGEKQSVMSHNQHSRKDLTRRVAGHLFAAILLFSALLFIPAGTLFYWEAWVYLALLFIPMSVVAVHLIRNDPELVERRLRMKEKEAEQKLIIKLSYVYFTALLLLPGFDQRYGWSSVSTATVLAADLVVVSGYLLFVIVLKQNRYASRIIEVVPQQQVVMTGSYALIRHPMYLAVLLMCTFTPLALGSLWAMIPTPLLLILLMARIRNEECVLSRELPGYSEYCQKVRYRIVPGIW